MTANKMFLGCWTHPREGWVNVDLYPQAPGILKGDARTLKGFSNESFDLILATHLIEHISHRAVPGMLRHWRRVLKSGGQAIVECPDGLAIARAYIQWHDDFGGEWHDDLSIPLVRKTTDKMHYRSWQTMFCGTHQHQGHWNGAHFDARRLLWEFTEAGFSEVRQEEPVESDPGWGPSIRIVGVR